MAGLFQVLWGQEGGELAPADALRGTDGEPLIITAAEGGDGYPADVDLICTRPTAVDWDHDGDLDLVVGNFAGTFRLFRGESEGRFQPQSEILMSGEDVLRISGSHGDPFCVDWDGDGDIDLLSGSTEGGVQWAENTADPGQPAAMSPFRTLIEPGPQAGQGEQLTASDLVGPTRSTRIWVDDVNNDGKLDILVGDNTTLVSPVPGLTEDEYEAQKAAWQERVTAASQKLAELSESESVDPEVQQKAYAEFSELYQQRSEFMTEERTGFVWLYRQK